VKLESRFFFAALAASVLVTATPASLAAAKTATAEVAGAILFRSKGCAHCHGENAEGTKKAPSLLLLWKDKNWNPAKITDQMINGSQKMPPFGDVLTDPEAAQLVAYLRAKHKPAPSSAPDSLPPPASPTK
jgi:mono/diheme cytochrome c family protein